MSKYNIAFKGLGLGLHEFEYEIGNEFFGYFDGGIIDEGNVFVKITLTKESSLLVLWFYVAGYVKVQCDRCLEYYDQPVKNEHKVFVRYGEESFEEGDDVIFLNPNDSHINVGKMIYDFIILAIPLRHIHPDDVYGKSLCNYEMIKKFEMLSSPAHPEQIDNRWDNLKKLLENK